MNIQIGQMWWLRGHGIHKIVSLPNENGILKTNPNGFSMTYHAGIDQLTRRATLADMILLERSHRKKGLKHFATGHDKRVSRAIHSHDYATLKTLEPTWFSD